MKKIFTTLFLLKVTYMGFSQIPTAGLFASYSFNSGNANDETGVNDGVIYGGVTLTEDRFGNAGMAYELDGIDGIIDFGDSTEFQMGTSDFALSFWYYYDTIQLGQVIGKRGSLNNYEQYTFITGNASGIPSPGSGSTAFFRTDGVNRALFLGDLRGSWHHVVMNHDYDSVTQVYIDGVLSSSSNTTFSGQLDVIGSSFNIGFFDFNAGYYFNGKIDDIYFYNRFLDETEILDLFNAENPTASVNETTTRFSIYPNPTKDIITLKFKEASDFEIFTLDGKLVESINKVQLNHVIDCSGYPSGVYFIKAGNQTQKFIKQ